MTGPEDPAAVARGIVDGSIYMVLGSADAAGRPWATPVYFATEDRTELFWVSDPGATHSVNLAARAELGIVIFDSRAPIGTGQAVYMAAVAAQVTGADVERGIAVFSRCSQADGGRAWSRADVEAPARLRLYRAVASEHFILDGADRRVPVDLRRAG